MDEKKLLPKLERGNLLMITINPKNQFNKNCPKTRIEVFNVQIGRIYKVLKKFLKDPKINREISEITCTEGDRFIPRIHYHAMGILTDPIEFYLQMSYLFDIHGAYHTVIIESEEQKDYYEKYINKQSQYWKRSEYSLCHRLGYGEDEEAPKKNKKTNSFHF